MRKKWSKDLIVSSILERQNRNQTLRVGHLITEDYALVGAANRYFGSWKKAIEASGLEYGQIIGHKRRKRKWSKERVIKEILALFEQGESLSSFIVQKQRTPLHTASVRYFGGWPQAIKAAGLKYDKIRLTREICYWTPKTICKEIVCLHNEGIPLYPAALRKDNNNYHVMSSGIRIFGTWSAALRAAGLDYSKIRRGRQPGWWTHRRVLMRIKALENQGIRLSYQDMLKAHGALVTAAIHKFGSWSQAVEAAGISYQKHCRIWSTKAWMRRMSTNVYDTVLERAKTHARKRRSKK